VVPAIPSTCQDTIVDRPMLDIHCLGEETNLAHVNSLGYLHHLVDSVLFVLAGCLILPNMLLAIQVDDNILFDDIAAAVMLIVLTTAISLCNTNNVEHMASKMSNSVLGHCARQIKKE
jgi:hypothetical protein